MSELPSNLLASLGSSYRIVGDLGGGGMSHVFVAHDDALDRDIVVKVLHRDLVDAVNLERFAREIRLAARLSHPHIVPLLMAGESGGRPYYTMPLVKGQSLRDRLRREGRIRVPDAVRILRDVAAALGYAHEQGVVHRDIKPDNILLTGDSAAVTDFGVAKALSASSPGMTSMTSMGVSLGTPSYMAPEQAAGDPMIDARADLYALGIMAFEMLGGHCPFDGRTVQATLAAHIAEPPPDIRALRADLPMRLSDLIMRCLAKDPADRPSDAATFIRTLDSLADPVQQTVRSTSAPRPVGSFVLSSTLSKGIAGAVAAAAVIFAAYSYVSRSQSSLSIALQNASPSARASDPAVSLAVLPFGGSSDSTETYLREGMAEQLMVSIARAPGVRVASRMSSFAMGGQTGLSTADIGKQLRVEHLLEGTIRREGARVRVFVQLTHAQDNVGLWSENFEFAAADVFTVQDSISRAVLNRLQGDRAGPASAAGAIRHGTRNLEAYDLYLRARYQFNKFDEAPLRESIRLYEEALQRDPQYADAWAGIASSWLFLADDYVAPSIAYPAARRAAEQALALDPTLADAHAARGSALFSFDWKFAEGRREIERAVAIDPRSFIVLLSQLSMYVALSQPDSVLLVLTRGLESDPLSPLNALLMGRFYGIVGRYDEAIEQYRRVVELAPPLAPFALLPIADAQIALGRKDDGENTLAQVRGMLPPPMHFLLASGEAGLGHAKVARALLAQYESVAKQTYVRPELIATVYARLGDRDAAIAWLEKSFVAHSPYLFSLGVDKQWDSLRGDPRFDAMVARITAITRAP